jgi:hypothetical protein
MSEDVQAYLVSKGLFLKRASADEVHLPCLWCNEPDGKRGRLYVNINPEADIPGLFHCKLCDQRGSLVTIRKFFGDATEKQEREDTSYQRRAILELAADYYHDALRQNEAVLKWLTDERGLSFETIDAHKLGYADGRDTLFRMLRKSGYGIDDITATGLTTNERDTGRPIDFLNDHITIPYMVAGNVVTIRGRAMGADVDEGRKYVTGPGQKARLFNTDATWGAEHIVVAEGEFDAMVAEQLGYNAVAVPGANTWQPAWDGYFEDARRVYVLFDRDLRGTGAKAATKLVERLGPKGRVVELPPHEKGKSKNDITEYVVALGHSKEEFDALLRATAGSLITVKQAIVAHADMANSVGLRLGMPELDNYLFPGLLPAQVMVILANTGAGKTIWLLNLFHQICWLQQDVKILFLSLEQTRSEWWERARRIYRFWNIGATDDDAEAFWSQRIWLDDRNRVSVGQFGELLEDFRYEVGQPPDLVAVDYLGYWAQSFKGERYERTSDAIMSMKEIAKAEKLRLISPHQVSRSTMHGSEPGVSGARDSGVVEETADFVMSLWRPDTAQGKPMEEHTGELKLSIGKSRHGGTGHVEQFIFAPLSLAIVRQASSMVKYARDELHYRNPNHETWEQAQIRHEVGLDRYAEWKNVVRQHDIKQRDKARQKQGKFRGLEVVK